VRQTVQRERMPFGWINSSSCTNAYYDEMVAELPQSVKERYFDDMALRDINDFEDYYAAAEERQNQPPEPPPYSPAY
jgi:hypothetical protein